MNPARHKTPHNHTFEGWVRRHYGKPYDPRVVFQKYDREIWRLARAPKGSSILPRAEEVSDLYATLIERAAAKVYSYAITMREAY